METNEEYLEFEANEPNENKDGSEFTDDDHMEDQEEKEVDYDEYYEKLGYIKVAGGLEQLEDWYDSTIEGYYEEMKEMIDNVTYYLDSKILVKLFKAIYNDPKYRYSSGWYALDEMPGVEIVYDHPDDRYMINLPYPACYVLRSELDNAYKEYGELTEKVRSLMDSMGYSARIEQKIQIEEEAREKKEKQKEKERKRKEKLEKLENKRKAEEIERKWQAETEERAGIQLSAIADYFMNPAAPYFHLGPVLCVKDKKVFIITQNHMYTNFDHKRNSLLIEQLLKFYDCIEVHEFHKDLQAPYAVGFFSQRRLFETTGWTHDVALLKCVSEHDEDPARVRADYIKWLAQNSDK